MDGNTAHLVDVLLLRLGHVSLALSLRLPSITFDARAAVRCSPRVQAARALGPDFEAAAGFALTADCLLYTLIRARATRQTDETELAAHARATLDIDGCVASRSRSSEASRARSAPRGTRFPARHRPSAPSARRDGPSPPPPSGTTAETEPYRGSRWMMRSLVRWVRDAGRRDRRWDRRGVSPRRP